MGERFKIMDERFKTFGERLQELEDNEKTYQSLRNRIKTLEEWKKQHLMFCNEGFGNRDHFDRRLMDLEVITAKLVGQRLPDRVRDLEEWKNHYHILDPDVEDRIKTLEEWKNHMIHILPKDHGALAIRLSHLEEWKRDHFLCKEDHGPCPSDTFKIKGNPKPNPNQKIKINKQVWEDLKYHIGYHYQNPPIVFRLSDLVDLIKKVEPDWNP